MQGQLEIKKQVPRNPVFPVFQDTQANGTVIAVCLDM